MEIAQTQKRKLDAVLIIITQMVLALNVQKEHLVKIAQRNAQTTCMESRVQNDVIARQTKFAIVWMDA